MDRPASSLSLLLAAFPPPRLNQRHSTTPRFYPTPKKHSPTKPRDLGNSPSTSLSQIYGRREKHRCRICILLDPSSPLGPAHSAHFYHITHPVFIVYFFRATPAVLIAGSLSCDSYPLINVVDQFRATFQKGPCETFHDIALLLARRRYGGGGGGAESPNTYERRHATRKRHSHDLVSPTLEDCRSLAVP
ncbi:uncharacterized protein J3D65DRAFT_275653 [Phyllosticta citribraziliensis]|uniref:Uncharacterized protein n=1 Tax=Phyllosticta citribraziliensis TaxID=989973 RepID=A0ABR1LVW0_9PEZI